MTSGKFDVILIGGGLFGAATASALAKDGASILLVEARKKHHTEGSSHGHSRIVRTLRSESSVFGEMARESFQRMQALNTPNRTVVRPVEAIFMMSTASLAFRNLTATDPLAKAFTSAEVFDKWHLKIKDGWAGIVDNTSGVMDPAALLDAFYEDIGLDHILWETDVTSWQTNSSEASVTTSKAETFQASKLVIAAGGWLPQLLERGSVDAAVKDRLSKLKLERIPLLYFDYPERMEPLVRITLFDDAEPNMFAMPEFDQSATSLDRPRYLKVGFHQGTRLTQPSDAGQTVHYLEQRYAIEYMEELLGYRPNLHHTSICLYALPPDLRKPGDQTPYNELPVLGPLLKTPRVYLAAYGGGVCAKHSLVLGQQFSKLVQGKATQYQMHEFDPQRLMGA
jgi:sarcosine oxidase